MIQIGSLPLHEINFISIGEKIKALLCIEYHNEKTEHFYVKRVFTTIVVIRKKHIVIKRNLVVQYKIYIGEKLMIIRISNFKIII